MKEPVGQLKGDHCIKHKCKSVYLSRRKKKGKGCNTPQITWKIDHISNNQSESEIQRELLKREKPTSGIN